MASSDKKITQIQPERKFHCFPHLPTEIQDVIWDFALDSQRSAHYTTLEEIPLTKFIRKWSDVPRHYYRIVPMAEVLVSAPPPPELATGSAKMSCALQHVNMAARRAVFRLQKIWGLDNTLQLYGANRTRRIDALNELVEDEDIFGDMWRDYLDETPPTDPNSHGEYPAPRIVDVPSLLVDSTRDLVIVRNGWNGVALHMRVGHGIHHRSPHLPIQRARYVALEWPGGPKGEGTTLYLFLFLRFRPEVLYILISPDDLDEDSSALEPTASETARSQREFLEKPFLRPVVPVEDQISTVPEQFWYGKREFFVVSWEEVERRQVSRPSQALNDIIKEIFEARKWEEDLCLGCGDSGCENRHERLPAAWRIMSWRDSK
ncbi:hypothetical protein CkaCkLH20_09379 [Colletotrichum karsti]|uniref:2EXR domain-containing protein n=1 Tax=Colletotrichum karsti TaxID=1095194 RepID=A0A9P6I3B2_9PEZI|nr:uncharacterized protein CkaCkLH20_09379 [Colletotrichum karsti]KAF9873216.1 hypothetical protein CkaCkLH20_09379 [Colletotrichum karsti]